MGDIDSSNLFALKVLVKIILVAVVTKWWGRETLIPVFCSSQSVRHYMEETRTRCHACLLSVSILNWGSPAGFVAWWRKRPPNPGNRQSKLLSASRKMRRETGAHKWILQVPRGILWPWDMNDSFFFSPLASLFWEECKTSYILTCVSAPDSLGR